MRGRSPESTDAPNNISTSDFFYTGALTVGAKMPVAAVFLKWSMPTNSCCASDVIPAFWNMAEMSEKFRCRWTIV